MKNGQDAAELPRRKRGRPPGSRKTTSISEQKDSAPRDELPAAINSSAEQKWSSFERESLPLKMNEVNEEQLTYGLVEDSPTSFSNFVHTILHHDRAEITRIAREMDVSENTIYRWMNGSSEPRAMYLKKLPDVLPEHRGNLSYVINQTFPGVLDMQMVGIREVRKDIYRRVLEIIAITTEEDTRFWQVSQAIFEYALLHLDIERHGMANADV